MSADHSPQKIAALITRLRAASAADLDETKISLVKLMLAAGQMPGFWSGEIVPPGDLASLEWKLVLRFDNYEDAHTWTNSPERSKLLQEIAADSSKLAIISDEITDATGTHGIVATSIVTEIKPGMEMQFFEWQEKVQHAQARREGYRGIYWQPPSSWHPHKWSSLLRFDSPENLEKWFSSDERHELKALQEEFVNRTDIRTVHSSYPGWFPIDTATGKPTPKWKTAMLILTALYPVVVLENRFLLPSLKGLGHPNLSTFISLSISILITTWISMPRMVQALSWWINPGVKDTPKVELKGALLVFSVIVIEVLIFNL